MPRNAQETWNNDFFNDQINDDNFNNGYDSINQNCYDNVNNYNNYNQQQYTNDYNQNTADYSSLNNGNEYTNNYDTNDYSMNNQINYGNNVQYSENAGNIPAQAYDFQNSNFDGVSATNQRDTYVSYPNDQVNLVNQNFQYANNSNNNQNWL